MRCDINTCTGLEEFFPVRSDADPYEYRKNTQDTQLHNTCCAFVLSVEKEQNRTRLEHVNKKAENLQNL